MDNDDAIIGTILSRRETFGLLGKAGLGMAFGGLLTLDAEAAYQAKVHKAVKLVAAPAVTEGPFYVDEKLNRSNLLAGTTRPAVIHGVPLTLQIALFRISNGKYAPLKNAAVDVWQCDAHGVYSDIEQEMNHENTHGQNWLRGVQTSGADGLVRFATIFPGWYESRTTHIHFKVRQPGATGGMAKEFTSQLFFDDKLADSVFTKAPYRPREKGGVYNANDMVFTERQVDGTQAGQHLMPEIHPSGKGFVAKYAIALTDSSFQPHRQHGPGGPGGLGGPPPGGFGGPPPDWP